MCGIVDVRVIEDVAAGGLLEGGRLCPLLGSGGLKCRRICPQGRGRCGCPRYNTRMGVSLRTLAKLTQPAIARWWKKRGMWLMGAGVVCLLLTFSVLFLLYFYPNTYWNSSVLELLGPVPDLVAITGQLCFMLSAVFIGNATVQACREIETENSFPMDAIPSSTTYTLALLRTWPTFIAAIIYAVPFWLFPMLSGTFKLLNTAGLAGWIGNLSQSIEWAGTAWLMVFWLIALQVAFRKRTWLPPVWLVMLYLIPLGLD